MRSFWWERKTRKQVKTRHLLVSLEYAVSMKLMASTALILLCVSVQSIYYAPQVTLDIMGNWELEGVRCHLGSVKTG